MAQTTAREQEVFKNVSNLSTFNFVNLILCFPTAVVSPPEAFVQRYSTTQQPNRMSSGWLGSESVAWWGSYLLAAAPAQTNRVGTPAYVVFMCNASVHGNWAVRSQATISLCLSSSLIPTLSLSLPPS